MSSNDLNGRLDRAEHDAGLDGCDRKPRVFILCLDADGFPESALIDIAGACECVDVSGDRADLFDLSAPIHVLVGVSLFDI